MHNTFSRKEQNLRFGAQGCWDGAALLLAHGVKSASLVDQQAHAVLFGHERVRTGFKLRNAAS